MFKHHSQRNTWPYPNNIGLQIPRTKHVRLCLLRFSFFTIAKDKHIFNFMACNEDKKKSIHHSQPNNRNPVMWWSSLKLVSLRMLVDSSGAKCEKQERASALSPRASFLICVTKVSHSCHTFSLFIIFFPVFCLSVASSHYFLSAVSPFVPFSWWGTEQAVWLRYYVWGAVGSLWPYLFHSICCSDKVWWLWRTHFRHHGQFPTPVTGYSYQISSSTAKENSFGGIALTISPFQSVAAHLLFWLGKTGSRLLFETIKNV